MDILSLVTYLGYFCIGIVSFIISPTLPVIIGEFGLTMGTAGMIFTSKAVGSFIGAIMGGVLSDSFGTKRIIVLGCLLQFAGFIVIALTHSWNIILLFTLLSSLGRGFLSICFNVLISDINPNTKGAAFNTLHGIYGVGSLVGPIIAGLILERTNSWRMIYYGAGALWFIFLLVTIPIKYPASNYNKGGKNGKETPKASLGSVILNPIVIMLFLVSFIYNGSASGLVGWINTYLDWMDFSILLGAGMISVFYLGLTIGRFTFRAIAEKVGYSRIIMICALGSFIFYPFAIYSTTPALITIGVLGSGIFLSGLHPTGLAYANTAFPSISGKVTALLSISMSLGEMSLPWLMGLVADKRDFRAGFSIGLMSIAVLIVVAISLIRYEKKAEIEEV